MRKSRFREKQIAFILKQVVEVRLPGIDPCRSGVGAVYQGLSTDGGQITQRVRQMSFEDGLLY